MNEVEFDDGGQNNDVLVVNAALIFRFPKYSSGLAAMAQEVAVLNGLRGRLPLAIPEPEYVHLPPRAGVGAAFMGYRLIPGQLLWPKALDGCDEAAVNCIAGQLGAFLRELHATPYAEAIGVAPPARDTVAEWREFHRRVQTSLHPHMRPAARRDTDEHISRLISRLSEASFAPALKHGDFGTGNLLFDPQTKQVRGVIDFGGAGIGDPAYDVASLLSFGEAFVIRLGSSYPQLPGLLDRARLYQGTFALMETLFGLENGDEEAFESGIAEYR